MDEAAHTFRMPTPAERAIIARLLSIEYSGVESLRAQLVTALVRVIDADGSLEFRVAPDVPHADVVRRVPVEAQAPDVDGVPINFLLHVVDGIVKELEVFRDDGSRIQSVVSANDLDPWASAGG